MIGGKDLRDVLVWGFLGAAVILFFLVVMLYFLTDLGLL